MFFVSPGPRSESDEAHIRLMVSSEYKSPLQGESRAHQAIQPNMSPSMYPEVTS
jgi:hypothetical protein